MTFLARTERSYLDLVKFTLVITTLPLIILAKHAQSLRYLGQDLVKISKSGIQSPNEYFCEDGLHRLRIQQLQTFDIIHRKLH